MRHVYTILSVKGKYVDDTTKSQKEWCIARRSSRLTPHTSHSSDCTTHTPHHKRHDKSTSSSTTTELTVHSREQIRDRVGKHITQMCVERETSNTWIYTNNKISNKISTDMAVARTFALTLQSSGSTTIPSTAPSSTASATSSSPNTASGPTGSSSHVAAAGGTLGAAVAAVAP